MVVLGGPPWRANDARQCWTGLAGDEVYRRRIWKGEAGLSGVLPVSIAANSRKYNFLRVER